MFSAVCICRNGQACARLMLQTHQPPTPRIRPGDPIIPSVVPGMDAAVAVEAGAAAAALTNAPEPLMLQ